jgi:hypothetical protein
MEFLIEPWWTFDSTRLAGGGLVVLSGSDSFRNSRDRQLFTEFIGDIAVGLDGIFCVLFNDFGIVSVLVVF